MLEGSSLEHGHTATGADIGDGLFLGFQICHGMQIEIQLGWNGVEDSNGGEELVGIIMP